MTSNHQAPTFITVGDGRTFPNPAFPSVSSTSNDEGVYPTPQNHFPRPVGVRDTGKRGVSNLPAWMTMGDNSSPAFAASNDNNVHANQHQQNDNFPRPKERAGVIDTGRRGVSNLPAWMTTGDNSSPAFAGNDQQSRFICPPTFADSNANGSPTHVHNEPQHASHLNQTRSIARGGKRSSKRAAKPFRCPIQGCKRACSSEDKMKLHLQNSAKKGHNRYQSNEVETKQQVAAERPKKRPRKRKQSWEDEQRGDEGLELRNARQP